MNYIIKTIQGCNLSCIYCYEQLHNKRNVAMSLDDAKGFMRKVYDYYVRTNPDEALAFHWHGGEPMLRGADFFDQILAFQTEVFGDGIRWFNTMQSNLTLLNESFIELFKTHPERLFLGISFDFYGDDRVDLRNRSVNARVWRNVKRLQDAGIETNFITMLTKGNVEHIDEIYDLVRPQNVSIRFNQVFGAPKKRPFDRRPVRLTNHQFCKALRQLTHRWIHDSECSFVINNAAQIMTKIVDPHSTRMCWFEKNCLADHMSIFPDGTVFPCDSIYFKEFSYGNIFHDSYEKILSSEPRQRLLSTLKKVQPECVGCDYLDYCNGGCPMRSMVNMPKKNLRINSDLEFGKDPLCSAHCDMFEMIGQYLAQEGVVEKDWTRRSFPPER